MSFWSFIGNLFLFRWLFGSNRRNVASRDESDMFYRSGNRNIVDDGFSHAGHESREVNRYDSRHNSGYDNGYDGGDYDAYDEDHGYSQSYDDYLDDQEDQEDQEDQYEQYGQYGQYDSDDCDMMDDDY